LVLKTAARRETPDRLSQGQYVAANARIMAKLAAKSPSPTDAGLRLTQLPKSPY
jgi:hypothetical protein